MDRLTSADVLPWLVAGLAVAVLLLGLGLLRSVRSVREAARRREDGLAAERAESRRLQDRLDALERRVVEAEAPARPEPTPPDYLITDLGAERTESLPATRIEGRLFADLVLRETVVKAASLAHGVRRALAPEHRLRMRAEVKREVKRSRKQRRAEIKEARRHLARVARQRAAARSEEDAA